MDLAVKRTQENVDRLAGLNERPPTWKGRRKAGSRAAMWPPRWVNTFHSHPFTRAHFYRFMAALMFLGLYGGSGSTAEEWGTSHTAYKQFLHTICSYHMYKNIKSALKLQAKSNKQKVI